MFKGALCHKGNQLKSTIGAVALQPQERPPETALCLFLKHKRRYPASKRQTHIDQHRPTQLDTSKRSPLEMLRSFHFAPRPKAVPALGVPTSQERTQNQAKAQKQKINSKNPNLHTPNHHLTTSPQKTDPSRATHGSRPRRFSKTTVSMGSGMGFGAELRRLAGLSPVRRGGRKSRGATGAE